MKHLTPYRQNEISLSPVRGRGMVYGCGLNKEFAQNNMKLNPLNPEIDMSP